MLVRLLVGLSGPAYSLGPGDVRDFDDAEAGRLIAAGFGVPASEAPMERAVKPPAPERRARRRKDA